MSPLFWSSVRLPGLLALTAGAVLLAAAAFCLAAAQWPASFATARLVCTGAAAPCLFALSLMAERRGARGRFAAEICLAAAALACGLVWIVFCQTWQGPDALQTLFLAWTASLVPLLAARFSAPVWNLFVLLACCISLTGPLTSPLTSPHLFLHGDPTHAATATMLTGLGACLLLFAPALFGRLRAAFKAAPEAGALPSGGFSQMLSGIPPTLLALPLTVVAAAATWLTGFWLLSAHLSPQPGLDAAWQSAAGMPVLILLLAAALASRHRLLRCELALAALVLVGVLLVRGLGLLTGTDVVQRLLQFIVWLLKPVLGFEQGGVVLAVVIVILAITAVLVWDTLRLTAAPREGRNAPAAWTAGVPAAIGTLCFTGGVFVCTAMLRTPYTPAVIGLALTFSGLALFRRRRGTDRASSLTMKMFMATGLLLLLGIPLGIPVHRAWPHTIAGQGLLIFVPSLAVYLLADGTALRTAAALVCLIFGRLVLGTLCAPLHLPRLFPNLAFFLLCLLPLVFAGIGRVNPFREKHLRPLSLACLLTACILLLFTDLWYAVLHPFTGFFLQKGIGYPAPPHLTKLPGDTAAVVAQTALTVILALMAGRLAPANMTGGGVAAGLGLLAATWCSAPTGCLLAICVAAAGLIPERRGDCHAAGRADSLLTTVGGVILAVSLAACWFEATRLAFLALGLAVPGVCLLAAGLRLECRSGDAGEHEDDGGLSGPAPLRRQALVWSITTAVLACGLLAAVMDRERIANSGERVLLPASLDLYTTNRRLLFLGAGNFPSCYTVKSALKKHADRAEGGCLPLIVDKNGVGRPDPEQWLTEEQCRGRRGPALRVERDAAGRLRAALPPFYLYEASRSFSAHEKHYAALRIADDGRLLVTDLLDEREFKNPGSRHGKFRKLP